MIMIIISSSSNSGSSSSSDSSGEVGGRSIGVGDGGKGCTCPLKFGKKYFSGNYYVKFGHFVNFSYIF